MAFRRRYIRKTGRRTARRTYRRSNGGGRRRFNIRRLIRKNRRPKVEIKFIDLAASNASLNPNSTGVYNASPTSIPLGTGVNQRIGSSVFARKLLMRVYMVSVPNPQIDDPEGMVRMTYYSPRRPASECLTHCTDTPFIGTFDHNIMTVHSDKFMRFTNTKANLTGSATAVGANQNSVPQERVIIKAMPFPRRITFTTFNENLDINKDIMYCCIKNNTNCVINNLFNTRMFYVDA